MSNIAENIKQNKLITAAIVGIGALFFYVNYTVFDKEVASNNKLLVNYKQNIDELKNYREPQIAVLLYGQNGLEAIVSPKQSYMQFLYKQYGKPAHSFVMDPFLEEEKIATYAKQNKLRPKAIELNSKNLDNYQYYYSKDDHEFNVANFIKDNKENLAMIIENSLKNNDHYKASKKNYPEALFDKGNSFIYDNNGVEVGSLNANIGIGQDIANNIYEAKKKGIDVSNFNIAILTEIKPIEYSNEDELYKQISPYKDGLVLRDGFRQAVFLPHMWSKHQSIDDFVNNLKIKATLLPNYKSNKIKFYKFRVLDI